MPEIGDSLGRYTLLTRLASGGMGEVFLAAKPGPLGFGPRVALKVLREQLASDQQFIDMLVDEANISMFLQHQNVVSVLDLAEDAGTYYIAMEYVQGLTVESLIERLIQKGRRMELPVALFIATELCRALKYAHTRVNHAGEPLNIIHRDVTPANILLSTQGEVKLTDFGIARAKGRIHQTQAGVLKGKFGYMAPEMIRYEAIDARADLFCAGVVIYLMITGRHPVAGATVMEAIQRYEDKQIAKPSSVSPEVPPALDQIVMRALEPQPDKRWPSAAALGAALQDVVMKHAQWRREIGDGAHRLSELIREIAPETFQDPVPPDVSDHLLRQALAREAGDEPAPRPGSTTSPQPMSDSMKLGVADTAPPPGPSSSMRLPRRGLSGPVTDRARDALVLEPFNQTTSESPMPAHQFDTRDGRRSDVAVKSVLPQPNDLETEEGLALSEVHAVRAQIKNEARTRPAEDRGPRRPVSSDKRAIVRPPQPDTGDLAPMENLDDIPTGVAPQEATLALQAIIDQKEGKGFLETSTDRHRLHDAMISEPALPAGPATDKAPAVAVDDAWSSSPGQEPTVASYDYEAELAARGQKRSALEDGNTVVGMYALTPPPEVTAPGPRDTDESARPISGLIPAPVDTSPLEDGGATVMGMAIPDWAGALDADPGTQPSPSTSGLARAGAAARDTDARYDAIEAETLARSGFRETDDAETVIPLGPSSAPPVLAEWADAPQVPQGDSTLLDGMDAWAVSEALDRQRGVAAPKPKVVPADVAPRKDKAGLDQRTFAGTLDPSAAVTDSDELDMDKVVADSLRTGQHKAVAEKAAGGHASGGPQLLSGPLRISFAPDGSPVLANGPASQNGGSADAAAAAAAALAASAEAKKKVAPVVREKKRAPADGPPGFVDEASLASQGRSALEVGAKTGRWMAGQLDAGELEWDDDAAARRAVATRNKPAQQPSRSSPVGVPAYQPPVVQGQPVSPAGQTFTGPNGRFAPQDSRAQGYGSVVPQAEPSAFARNWPVIVALAAAFLAVGVVTGILLFTQVLWPKLRLESDPPGASVIVDDVPIEGRTPVTVKVEPERPHTIELRAEGYRSERREITDGVGRGRTYSLQVAMRRIVPVLELGGVEGTVFVNGKEIGRGHRVGLVDLAADAAVTIRVEAPGYRPWEQRFERAASIPESVDVPMSKLP
ncbi:protein kinase [Myxococcota bacterium]|nr:protein kinase [Myxococcota bacterium]